MVIVSHPADSSSVSSDLLDSISLHGSKALVLDAIKRGEDDEDVSRGDLPTRNGRSIIIRVYESLGGRARGMVSLGHVLGVRKVFKTNALEDDEEETELKHGAFKIELRGFEVATYRLQL